MGCQTCYLERFSTHVAARPLLSAVVIERPCDDRGEAVVSMPVAEHATVMKSAARTKTTARQVVATFGDYAIVPTPRCTVPGRAHWSAQGSGETPCRSTGSSYRSPPGAAQV
jgi:hypothetical protein